MFRNTKSARTNTAPGYELSDSVQTRNSGEVVQVSAVIAETEACGAMDTIPFEPNTRNLDLGGGRFDLPSEHVKTFYQVENLVYDPYNRSPEHNARILAEVKRQPVDTVTSNSVLNVILEERARNAHIQLAYQALRKGGTAFFKVWRGNNSGLPTETQVNKEALHFFGEVCDVFGECKVFLPQDDCGNTLVAKK